MKDENRIKKLCHLSTKTLAMIQLAVVTYEQAHCKGSTEWNDLLEDLQTGRNISNALEADLRPIPIIHTNTAESEK